MAHGINVKNESDASQAGAIRTETTGEKVWKLPDVSGSIPLERITFIDAFSFAWNAYGDSFTAGSNATVAARYYVNLINETINGVVTNNGTGGDGVFNAFKRMAQGQAVPNSAPCTLLMGLNDVTRNYTTAGLARLKNGHRSIIAQHLLSSAVAANNAGVTAAGTWTTLAAGTYNDKASLTLSGLARVSSVAGSTLTRTVSGTSVVIGCWGCDGTTFDDGGFTVHVDGVLKATHDPDNKAVFVAGQDPGRNHDVIVITGLTDASHTVLITTTENKPTPIDYIGVLQAITAPTILIGKIMYRTQAGYDSVIPTYTPASDAVFDQANQAIQEAVTEFSDLGFRVALVDTNNEWYPATHVDTGDNIHPNDSGMEKIAQNFLRRILIESRGFFNTTSKNASLNGIVRATNNNVLSISMQALSTGQATSGIYIANSAFLTTTSTALNIGSQVASSTVQFYAGGLATTDVKGLFNSNGRWRLGDNTTPTAILHLKAGTATASTAPLKFTSGTNLTTAEAGAMEYNGTNLFFTRSGTTRENVVCASAVNSVSPTAPDRTITVNINGTTYYIHAKTTND